MAKVCGAIAFGFLPIFLIFINNLNLCAVKAFEENENFVVHANSYTIPSVKLREKRDTAAINQYHSITQQQLQLQQNVSNQQITSSTTSQPQKAQTDPAIAGGTSSVMVSYNANEHPQLGFNGTGQLKDRNNTHQQQVVLGASATVSSSTVATIAITADDKQEELIDHIDVPENETITTLQNQNLTINETTDHHNYYNSTMYINTAEVNQMWNSIKDFTPNPLLSKSHRRAMTIELSFDFPFYGHKIRNVTVATGGFIYTGEYVHSWLAAAQYIAPFMANFDTSLSNDSYVRLNDNGTVFTVIWENVLLQDKQDVGKFTFVAALHQNGDIVFTYVKVPVILNAIQDDKHPVKVGLSDAYIVDKTVFLARRKTIYEYHRVNFASSDISNATIIYLKALSTCLQYTDCASCINHNTTFPCAWCPVFNRCSTGTDRKKQEWVQKGCERAQINDAAKCPAIGEKGNNANQANPTTERTNTDGNNNNQNIDKSTSTPKQGDAAMLNPTITPTNVKPVSNEMKAPIDEHHAESKSMALALGFLVPICLVITIMLWVLYAYRNPHTKSGQLLIQYRPSQWTWRRGEARYTAATIHM